MTEEFRYSNARIVTGLKIPRNIPWWGIQIGIWQYWHRDPCY